MRRKATLFTSFTFTWWPLGLVKISLLSLGVAVGATWPGVFVVWRDLLLVLFVVPAFYWFSSPSTCSPVAVAAPAFIRRVPPFQLN